MILTLKEHRKETADIDTFLFAPEAPFDYQSGQFLQYTLVHDNADNRGSKRYFSIASAPAEGVVQLTTRFAERSSSFKTALRALQPGQTIEAYGPSGDFTYDDPSKPTVWIAGGIGITPFRSILMDLDAKDIDATITLFYANRTDDIAFKDDFDQLMAKHPNLKVIYVLDNPPPGWSGETGFITAAMIKKYISDLSRPTFYISGPEPMVEAFGTMFVNELGIDKERIKQDFFPGYADEHSGSNPDPATK